MEERHRHSLLSEAKKVFQELGMDLPLERREVQDIGPRKLVLMAAKAQEQQLLDTLRAKTIHGVFMKTSQRDTRDFKLAHRWLKRGKQRAETEALIVAAQDWVIMTRAYKSRVLKLSVNPMCRKRGLKQRVPL